MSEPLDRGNPACQLEAKLVRIARTILKIYNFGNFYGIKYPLQGMKMSFTLLEMKYSLSFDAGNTTCNVSNTKKNCGSFSTGGK